MLKFHKNPFSGSSCSMPTDRQDMMELIVAFRNFAKVSKLAKLYQT